MTRSHSLANAATRFASSLSRRKTRVPRSPCSALTPRRQSRRHRSSLQPRSTFAFALQCRTCSLLRGLTARQRDIESTIEPKTIDRLEVRWPQPSGAAERFTNLAVDQYITIVEGTGKWE